MYEALEIKDYFGDEYEVKSEKELQMEQDGFSFITNFMVENESLYRESAEVHHLSYRIENETYNFYGKEITSTATKAFYVDSNIYDLSEFWRTFDSLKVDR